VTGDAFSNDYAELRTGPHVEGRQQNPRCVMAKGNNAQSKDKKKPKKDAKAAPVKSTAASKKK